MARRTTPQLPEPTELERICKGLAALDAMMSDDWESRYYSFNKAWNKKRKERMASMRNGSGDDWFIVFSASGVFVKAFWHEYPRDPGAGGTRADNDVDAIYKGLPKGLAHHRKEAAFLMDDVTFGGWHDGKAWTLRGNAKPMKDELAMLAGAAKAYRAYADAYFEVELPLDAIEHVLSGNKLDAKLVAKITKDLTLADLKADLAEIGY
jgi:hypothetical protein